MRITSRALVAQNARRVNDYAIKAVKLEGPFLWHDHLEDDEAFYVLRGAVSMEYRSGGIERVERFGPGELLGVPKGVEHRPVADAGTELLLFERESLANTGAASASGRRPPNGFRAEGFVSRPSMFFDGFTLERVDLSEATLRGGTGSPVLLLHGHPRTHTTWYRVAPLLASHMTVVCADLRGFGKSS